jgi:hypothetical protein
MLSDGSAAGLVTNSPHATTMRESFLYVPWCRQEATARDLITRGVRRDHFCLCPGIIAQVTMSPIVASPFFSTTIKRAGAS